MPFWLLHEKLREFAPCAGNVVRRTCRDGGRQCRELRVTRRRSLVRVVGISVKVYVEAERASNNGPFRWMKVSEFMQAGQDKCSTKAIGLCYAMK